MAHRIEEISVTRPPTGVLTTRMDRRTLASWYLFWTERGEAIRSLSELVRLTMERTLNGLIATGDAEFVETQEAATQILTRAGLGTKRFNSSNQQILMTEMQREHLVSEGQDPAYLHKSTKTKMGLPTGHPLVGEAIKRMETADLKGEPKDLKTRVQAMLKRDKELDSLGTVPGKPERGEEDGSQGDTG